MTINLRSSILCLQETFMTKEGNIKFENSFNYQIFESVHLNGRGGGLAIGALKSLNPVLIKDGK